jgi:hypothetical protein
MTTPDELDKIALEEDFGADITQAIACCDDETSLQILIDLATQRLKKLAP